MRAVLIAAACVVALAAGVWLAVRTPPVKDASATPSAVAPLEEPPTPAAPLTTPQAHAERPSPSTAPTPRDEMSLMERLRAVKASDPATAITLATEGNRRFPEGPSAPERASILIHALATQGHSSEARGAAEDAVNRYPDSSWVREIEQFTGAHRHRNIHKTDAGQLEYY